MMDNFKVFKDNVPTYVIYVDIIFCIQYFTCVILFSGAASPYVEAKNTYVEAKNANF